MSSCVSGNCVRGACVCMDGYYGALCDRAHPDNTTSTICSSYDVIAGESLTCRLIPRREGERINATSQSFAFHSHSTALVMVRDLSEESDGSFSYVLATTSPQHGAIIHHSFTTIPVADQSLSGAVTIAAAPITVEYLPDETSIVRNSNDYIDNNINAEECRFHATKRPHMSASR